MSASTPAPSKVASEYLGHSSTGITENTYQHVLPGMQAQVAVVMGALLDELAADGPDEGEGAAQ